MDVIIPYIVEGEIINVNETPSDTGGLASALSSVIPGGQIPLRGIVTYTCRVSLPDGIDIVVPNAIDGSFFGGIDDYFQIRRRSTTDGSTFQYEDADTMDAHIGDRVYIAFINGNVTKPIIVSGAQHPNQINRFSDGVSQSVKPQMFMRYLGISTIIDEDGQFSLTHFGAPKIKFTGESLTGTIGDAFSDVTSLVPSGGYEGFSDGDSNTDETDSDAIDPQSLKYKTMMEFLSDGRWRIRDSIGQNIKVDPKESKITITNNDITSLDDEATFESFSFPGLMDAEAIVLDASEQSILVNGRKKISIFSGDSREDTTEGDHSHKIIGDESITIGGDKEDKIGGSVTRKIAEDLDETIGGDASWLVIGDITLENEVGSGIKISGGTVEIGGAAAGLFDTVVNTLDQISEILKAIMQLTVPTSVGPSSVPINMADFSQILTKIIALKTKISSVTGSL